MTYTEQVDQILSSAITPEDIIRLHSIKRQMTKDLCNFNDRAIDQEKAYNQYRHTRYIEWRNKEKKWGKPVGDAEADKLSKAEAEEIYGSYKESQSTSKNLKLQIDSIQQFIMWWYFNQKNEISWIISES